MPEEEVVPARGNCAPGPPPGDPVGAQWRLFGALKGHLAPQGGHLGTLVDLFEAPGEFFGAWGEPFGAPGMHFRYVLDVFAYILKYFR